MIWTKAGDGGAVTEGTLVARRTPMTAEGHEVRVFNKGYVELLHSFATDDQVASHESKAASRELEFPKATVREFEIEVHLHTADS